MDMRNAETGLILFFSFVLIVSSLYVRVIPLRAYHWWDECVYLLDAEKIMTGNAPYDEMWFRPPLLSVLIGLFNLVFPSPFSGQMVSAVLSWLVVPASMWIAKKLYGWKESIIAGLLAGFGREVVYMSGSVMTGLPSAALAGISFAAAMSGSAELAAMMSGLAFLMRYPSAIAVIPGLLVLKSAEKRIRYAGVFLITTLPYFIWSWQSFGSPFSSLISAMRFVSDVNGPFYFYFIHPFSFYSLFTVAGFVAFILFMADNNERKPIPLILLFWVLLELTLASFMNHKEPRYLSIIAVPFFVLSSRGYGYVLEKTKKPALSGNIASIATFLFVLSILLYASYEALQLVIAKANAGVFNTVMTDTARAGLAIKKYAASHDLENATVYAYTEWPVYAYYSTIHTEIMNRHCYKTGCRLNKPCFVISPDKNMSSWLESLGFKKLMCNCSRNIYFSG